MAKSILNPKVNAWKRRHLGKCLNNKRKNSGHGLYLGNQIKGSTEEFITMKPIVSCAYFLAIPDRNPIAGVIEQSAYFWV